MFVGFLFVCFFVVVVVVFGFFFFFFFWGGVLLCSSLHKKIICDLSYLDVWIFALNTSQ